MNMILVIKNHNLKNENIIVDVVSVRIEEIGVNVS